MFALAWQYLTGRAVATDPTDRQVAEWPPHPDRIFQALVAAWGESGADADGAAALDWLAALSPPALSIPEVIHPGAAPKVYVPVNDLEGSARGEYGDKLLALLPDHRSRKERYFPATVVGDGRCVLRWDGVDPMPYLDAFRRLVSAVTHVGHSSSLVRMWVETSPPPATLIPVERGLRRDLVLRVPEPNRRAVLVAAYADGGSGWQRPPTARWQDYVAAPAVDIPHGDFDDRLLILRRCGGDIPHLAQTIAFSAALRGALMKGADGQADALAAISGHAADGSPATTPHVAYLPLPFVGDRHADGHLLGLALALPHNLPPIVERGILDALIRVQDEETGAIRLNAGPAGACDLMIEDRPAPPCTLRSPTWCRPNIQWASVTPIVLDRFPPKRHDDVTAFAVVSIIEACHRQGLPTPVDISIFEISALIGAPSVRAFPPMPRKVDGAKRWMIHAALTFPVPVSGPLLLGAGRYRGYGLCRPLVTGTATC